MAKKKTQIPNTAHHFRFTKEYGENSTKDQYMKNLETLVKDIKKSIVEKEMKVYHSNVYAVSGYDVELGANLKKSEGKRIIREADSMLNTYSDLTKLIKKAKKTTRPDLKIRYHITEQETKGSGYMESLPADESSEDFGRITRLDFCRPENSMSLHATLDKDGKAEVFFNYLKSDQIRFRKIDKCIENLLKKGYAQKERFE